MQNRHVDASGLCCTSHSKAQGYRIRESRDCISHKEVAACRLGRKVWRTVSKLSKFLNTQNGQFSPPSGCKRWSNLGRQKGKLERNVEEKKREKVSLALLRVKDIETVSEVKGRTSI